ncbi:hypothetical protein HYY75_07945 [bacterium]|nr:hypothetical protein [bacterium]
MRKFRFVWAFLGLFLVSAVGSVFGASPQKEVIYKLKLIDNNHAPQKILVIFTSGTSRFVKDLFNIIKKVNEAENLPESARIKLHIITSGGDPISQLGISQEDAEKYLEVNKKFSSGDIWVQDCMELCSAQLSQDGKFVPAVFDSNRGRGLSGLPKVLAEMWGLTYAKNPSNSMAHGDYGGNLEVVPFDDVLVSGNTITKPCKEFLEKAGYSGRMFNPETRWLTVGHIDEYLSFIPTPHAPRGYSIVRADPEYGLEVLSGASDEDFSKLDSGDRDFLLRVRAVIQAQKRNPNQGKGSSEDNFIALNRKIGEIIDKNVAQLKDYIRKVTNDPTRDFEEIAWPCFFEGRNGSTPSGCCAYLPGVVNLLVVRNHLVVPDCYFPPFNKIIEARFRSQGNKVHFIDDTPYHNSMGEVHCGTNVLRALDKIVLTKAQVAAVQAVKNRFNAVHGRATSR